MAIQSNFPAIKPSLMLDFANTKSLDPRITFTRASTASYYDGVTTSKAEENLFTYSQDFDDASWSKFGASVTANATTAPDGTTTADSLVSTATPASVYLTRTPTFTASQPYVMSFYVKANTANFIQIITASAIVPSGYVNFNVTSGAGAIGNYGGTGITPSIVDVGNGWYRCVLTIASVAGSGAIEFHLVDSATAARSATYSGTIGTGVYLWGAQLENRSAISAYTATTTQAITNYIPKLQSAASGVARFDNNPTTGESLGLLIEEQRTNLQTYSADFSNAVWTKNSVTISSNTLIAPDGTLTADTLTATAGAAYHYANNATGITTSGSNTFSFYVKKGTATWIFFGVRDTSLNYFNLDTGAFGTTPDTCSVQSVGNSWYRISVTKTETLSTIPIGIAGSNGGATYTATGYETIFIWGAQLEAGAFATSYIPTVASQVTRSADAASMTGTNFSSWYSAGEGTIYAETGPIADAVYPTTCCITDGTSSNSILTQGNNTGNGQQLYVVSGGTIQVALSNQTLSLSNTKTASAYKVNDYAYSTQGATATTDTSALVPVVNQLVIGAERTSNLLNGTIKKLAYYPLRVTNAQLQALTS